MKNNKLGILFAILAALCYSLLNPISKLFANEISPLLSASLLYFGMALTGIIIIIFQLISHKISKEKLLSRQDIPYLLLAIIFHSGSAISLMFGLRYLSSSNASLLASFEIISTSLIAFFLFKEDISKYLWIGIFCIFVACIIISLGDIENIQFSLGSVLCLISPISMGFANNFLKKIAHKEPSFTISYLGLGGGLISLIIAFSVGERFTSFIPVISTLSLGVVAYGIALVLFIYAERLIGASKTSAFFSLAPFIAVILSLIIFLEKPNYTFYIGLAIMIIGTIFASLDVIIYEIKARHSKSS